MDWNRFPLNPWFAAAQRLTPKHVNANENFQLCWNLVLETPPESWQFTLGDDGGGVGGRSGTLQPDITKCNLFIHFFQNQNWLQFIWLVFLIVHAGANEKDSFRCRLSSVVQRVAGWTRETSGTIWTPSWSSRTLGRRTRRSAIGWTAFRKRRMRSPSKRQRQSPKVHRGKSADGCEWQQLTKRLKAKKKVTK